MNWNRLAATALAAALSVARTGHGGPLFTQRFGVVDIIPASQSGEINQNSEPSLAVGRGGHNGQFVVHSFALLNPSPEPYFTSSGNPLVWTQSGALVDSDATLDWSRAGTVYAATLPAGLTMVSALNTPNPITTPFATIAGATVTGKEDQPWVKVYNGGGLDHIYIGFNDLIAADWLPGSGSGNANTASVRFSLDGGGTWTTTALERLNPAGGQDSPAVRLAISADGQTVYALFQRWTSWAGYPGASDANGQVVLTRSDNAGLDSWNALPNVFFPVGTVVSGNIRPPWISSLGAQRMGANCDVAVSPVQPRLVYVAYTEIVSGSPMLRVRSSSDGGATFTLAYTVPRAASVPSLAVTTDGTVGLLYAASASMNLEVHFLKALGGDFGNISDRVLARFPNNSPVKMWDPYIGDYFQLKAVGYNFYGTFSASNDPQPDHFPSGVYFQRKVNVGGMVQNNFWLAANGTLVDNNNNPVSASIDPFFFWDIAPVWYCVQCAQVAWVPPTLVDPGDPYAGLFHINWPVLAGTNTNPMLQLQAATSLTAQDWAPVTTFIQTDGSYESAISMTQKQQFFRLSQDLTGAQFQLLAAAGANGVLSPKGALVLPGLQSQTFTATPSSGYYVANWYLDGALAQSGGSSFTISNLTADHTVLATFAPANDLAVSIAGLPLAPESVQLTNDLIYEIRVSQLGLSASPTVTVTNPLSPTVVFKSATTTQGTVTNSGGLVWADLGALGPGATAVITIDVLPTAEGSLTDTVSVASSLYDPNLANNTATDVIMVVLPLSIVTQPSSQTVPVGSSATFSVGASGSQSAPFGYQWFYNGSALPGATNSTLVLNQVTASQAGSYFAYVYQVFAPEDILDANSDTATLTVK